MAIRLRGTVQVTTLVTLAALSARCGGDKAEGDMGACVDESCVDASAEGDSSSDSSSTSSSETSSSTDGSTETDGEVTSTDTNDPCAAPEVLCDNQCVNPLNDSNNCGSVVMRVSSKGNMGSA